MIASKKKSQEMIVSLFAVAVVIIIGLSLTGGTVCVAFNPSLFAAQTSFAGRSSSKLTKRRESLAEEEEEEDNPSFVEDGGAGSTISSHPAPLWRVGSAEVNIPEKILVLYDFTIDNPNNNIVIENYNSNDVSNHSKERVEALRVGRFKISWDNFWYTTRTFELELENIEGLIEFTNLKLTQSNWDELMEKDFYDWLMAEVDEKGNVYDEEGFFHFSSISLSGNVTIHLASRPLDKLLGSFTVDADASRTAAEFNKRIGERSEENLRLKKRKGIMFAELADLLKIYLDEVIQTNMPAVFKSRLGNK
jgi:hypothetical protein